ncbi:unnamed protein product [Adineta ricciae]|uniref:F-box domain-containing protein n=1 Tax=Adineta ricciae TaxID=249248 RepID=A0A815W8B5_ADIRI|nr:unnamed protein product [Adineta ricciae]
MKKSFDSFCMKLAENGRSISTIENLSNECFYEIFDYLAGCEIYEAFSNLNFRFQQILRSCSLAYKIISNESTSYEMFTKSYRQIMRHHQSQILSIHIDVNDSQYLTASLFIVNSQYIRLESLVFYTIEADPLYRLLQNLRELPRLFSLKIDTQSSLTLKQINYAYQLAFALPKLNSFEFDTGIHDNRKVRLLSISTPKQMSGITRLFMGQSCSFQEVYPFLTYTPKLRRLILAYVVDDQLDAEEENVEYTVPIILKNLTHLVIERCETKFDALRLHLERIRLPELRFFRCKIDYIPDFHGVTRFDADQWASLIEKHFPQLKICHLTYPEWNFNSNGCEILEGNIQLNRFYAPFWVQRQWILNIVVNKRNIVVSIYPYKKQWYELTLDDIDNNLTLRLMLKNQLYSDDFLTFFRKIVGIREIGYLEIDYITIEKLIQILNLLPKLIALKISSLSTTQAKSLSNDELEILKKISKENQITKIYLEQMNHIEEICFLLTYCPQMTYLKIGTIGSLDIDLFLRIILLKISDHPLQFLSFAMPLADDETVKQLQTMIDFEKLLFDYTISRHMTDIILKRKYNR